ncbi:MAG: hypothetical protein KME35_07675 [Aphanocapsa sp. GSE-SYN-MK-11-07L]|nr:hypothetical protein [Aphanocapsa sp. GSE-SYN-MK-11-07L]
MLHKTANYSATRPRSPLQRMPVPGRSPASPVQPRYLANVPLGEDALLVEKGRSPALTFQQLSGTKSPPNCIERLCIRLSLANEMRELRYRDKESQWRLTQPSDSLPPKARKVGLSKTLPLSIAEKPTLPMPKANHYVVDGSKLTGARKSILLGGLPHGLARSPVLDYPLLTVVR